jgi:quercetin dioxygenase-like cupin family protein
MEPFLIEVMPEAATSSSHQGEEFIYVLEGALRVEYGRDAHTLLPGDSIYYNSLVPHAVSAEGGPARILAVLYFPL